MACAYENLIQVNRTLEIATSGNAGFLNNDLVDLRLHPEAEPFSDDAVKQIIIDLTNEKEVLEKEFKLEKENRNN